MWKQRDIQLETPDSLDVDKYAKAIEPPNDKLICNNVPVSEFVCSVDNNIRESLGIFVKLQTFLKLSQSQSSPGREMNKLQEQQSITAFKSSLCLQCYFFEIDENISIDYKVCFLCLGNDRRVHYGE